MFEARIIGPYGSESDYELHWKKSCLRKLVLDMATNGKFKWTCRHRKDTLGCFLCVKAPIVRSFYRNHTREELLELEVALHKQFLHHVENVYRLEYTDEDDE